MVEQDALATRDVQHARAQAHRAARRDVEHEVRLLAALEHVGHLAAGSAEDLDNLAGIFARHVDGGLLDRLELLAVLVDLHQHARTSHLELEALAAHRLHQHRQMQNATAGDFHALRAGNLGDAHRDVRFGLVVQALAQLARTDDLAVASHERARRGLEDNGHRGLLHLDGVEAHRMLAARHHVADVGVFHAHHGHDIAGGHDLLLFLLQVLEREHLLDVGVIARAVVLQHQHGLALVDGAGRQASDADAADEARMVDRAHLQGDRTIGVDVRRGNLLQDGVEQRQHVHVAIFHLVTGIAAHRARVDDREIELLVGSVELDHQVEHLVDHFLGATARTVDLVDDHDDA